MPQNLEMKAVFPDLRFRGGDCKKSRRTQQKAYLAKKTSIFDIPRGRLKLRILNKRNCELIAYTRPQ